jgi:WD40 repeat protein
MRLLESEVERARAGRFSHRVGQRIDSLAALAEAAKIGRELKLPGERFERLRDEAIACMALPDMTRSGPPIHEPEGTVAFAFDAGMTRYATRLRDGTILVRQMSDDREIARFRGEGESEIWVFEFSPSGRYLAALDRPSNALVVWDVDRKVQCLRDPGPISGSAAAFSPDSQRIALAHQDGSLKIHDLARGLPIKSWRGSGPSQDLAYRPDGSQIAVISATRTATCRVLDANTGHLLSLIALPGSSGVGWSPDGTSLVTTNGSRIMLWDAATGQSSAILEGATSGGLGANFNPSGTLVGSNGWEGRLRLWDAVLGRQILSVSSSWSPGFSLDGRIFVRQRNELTPWKVESALEYRTLAHLSSQPLNYQRPSIHPDGWILAVGTDRGVLLWDLARGSELAFLQIGLAWHSMFDISGDLLTNGPAGFWQWPVQIDPSSGSLRIGPPGELPLPGTRCGIAEDQAGRIIAVASRDCAYVAQDGRKRIIAPLNDCRGVSVSPDGHWLATGSHSIGGVNIWNLPEGSRVTTLSSELGTSMSFSPDGRWLMTEKSPCRLYQVGTWRELRRFDGDFACFSPDSRLAVIRDVSSALVLIEIETGRTLARLESPDQHAPGFTTFSPDGSRLVVTTNDLPPCVHVWSLRTIRRQLGEIGLDWEAPSYPEEDPARADLPLLPALQIDYGPLAEHVALYSEPPEVLLERSTAQIRKDRNDARALHLRGHVLMSMNRDEEALADFTALLTRQPQDAHFQAYRGICLFNLKRYGPALDLFETVLKTSPQTLRGNLNVNVALRNRAWELAKGDNKLERDPAMAVRMAELAVALEPDEPTSLNTLRIAQYRSGRYAEAVATVAKSLTVKRGERGTRRDSPDDGLQPAGASPSRPRLLRPRPPLGQRAKSLDTPHA